MAEPIENADSTAPSDIPNGGDEFRMIAESAPVAVWVTGLDGKRSFVNRVYAEFLGVDQESARDFNWRSILHPDDSARIIAEAQAGKAALKPFTLEGRYRRADGEWRWLKSTLQPRRDGDGNPAGFFGVAHDVTETKLAELALREREAQLLVFVNQGTAGFSQVDISGRFTMVNDRFCEISGWPREELLGRSMQSITHPNDLGRNIPLFERMMRDGTPYSHEKRYVRPDGTLVWVNNSVALIRDDEGKPLGSSCVTLDVTRRREDEAALRKSEESIRLAVESAGMATWELDLDTMEGVWSLNRFDLLGLPRRADGRGSINDWLALIHPDDVEQVRETAYACFDRGTPFMIEYRILRADTGEERWLQSHGDRIMAGDENDLRFVAVSFDITERKRNEEELRTSETRFRTIFEEANDYIITADLDTRITSVNPSVVAALGYPEDALVGRSISEFLAPGQMEVVERLRDHKLEHGGTTRFSVRMRTHAAGGDLIWEINSRLTLDALGRPTGIHAIARDVTESKRFEMHQRLLIDELNHRVKNTLAIVQGIAQQTFRNPGIAMEARKAFEGRIAALSEAHNLLTRELWAPVPIHQVMADAIAPHCGGDRCHIEGCDLTLEPKTAISLALAIHELATNAVKHGALSNEAGRISITWQKTEDEKGKRLKLAWVESDGPPVSVPKRRGFGTRMIERGLAAELGGSVCIEFAAGGLRCEVDAPLPETAE
ncbi:PAS domain S-box protein [Sphingosinithalassobacter tenebrarum]|uniref:histidine kinase n=2 Tax=Stakelama tenebrarum TaxID=2711215 RepID=A0A6G6Y4J9_9SPHN|nr:PAS domain S-box protein [Sphingosinithalassobacter tenebrarum]